MISIKNFTKMVIDVSGKSLSVKNIEGPTGVRGRNSDNRLISEKLGWSPSCSLRAGVEKTYKWIVEQVNQAKFRNEKTKVNYDHFGT
jgi:GDP-D-mannose 3', 5'-epimerase